MKFLSTALVLFGAQHSKQVCAYSFLLSPPPFVHVAKITSPFVNIIGCWCCNQLSVSLSWPDNLLFKLYRLRCSVCKKTLMLLGFCLTLIRHVTVTWRGTSYSRIWTQYPLKEILIVTLIWIPHNLALPYVCKWKCGTAICEFVKQSIIIYYYFYSFTLSIFKWHNFDVEIETNECSTHS